MCSGGLIDGISASKGNPEASISFCCTWNSHYKTIDFVTFSDIWNKGELFFEGPSLNN